MRWCTARFPPRSGTTAGIERRRIVSLCQILVATAAFLRTYCRVSQCRRLMSCAECDEDRDTPIVCAVPLRRTQSARRWVLPAREVGRRSTVSLRFQSCGCRRDTCAELVRFAPHCRLLPARRLLFAKTQTSRRFNATRRNSAPIHDNRDTPVSAAKAP